MIKSKITPLKTCLDGKHTFVPAHWHVKASSRDCTLFVCQHCLLSVDKAEREMMTKHHNDRIKDKIDKEKALTAATPPKG